MLQEFAAFLVGFLVICHRYCCCNADGQNTPSPIQRFAGDPSIELPCPTENNLEIHSVHWYLTPPGGDRRLLNLSVESGLLQHPDNVRYLNIEIRPENEGEYHCRRNEETEQHYVQCLLVLGRPVFSMCLPNSNCEAEQPFQLTATPGENVILDSSITFVNGGSQNEDIKALNLFRGPSYLCTYNLLHMQGCENNGLVQDVQVSKLHQNMSVLITLQPHNMSDMGQYQVTMITDLQRKSIYFNVSTGVTTQTTAAADPTSTKAADTSKAVPTPTIAPNTAAPTTADATAATLPTATPLFEASTTEDSLLVHPIPVVTSTTVTVTGVGEAASPKLVALAGILVILVIVIVTVALLVILPLTCARRRQAKLKISESLSPVPSEEMSKSDELDLMLGQEKSVVIQVVNPQVLQITPDYNSEFQVSGHSTCGAGGSVVESIEPLLLCKPPAKLLQDDEISAVVEISDSVLGPGLWRGSAHQI